MTNPYRVKSPALISFSGGRTSGYMLWHILDAYDGELPSGVNVAFANTGKEREETLRFVHECGVRWKVDIHWLEYRHREKGDPPENGFAEVGYNSASRKGEPFADIIRRKQYLPNATMRYCTIELKIRPMTLFMQAQGFARWTNVIGLRGDEMHRVFKAFDRAASGKDPFGVAVPMATHAAGMVRQEDVQAFWKAQPFDLGIHSADGNCDLCFLKNRQSRARRIRQDPAAAEWWIEQEQTAKHSMKAWGRCARFVADETVEELRRSVLAQPLLPLGTPEDEDFDAECGLWCAGE